jgi:hypothetical protein
MNRKANYIDDLKTAWNKALRERKKENLLDAARVMRLSVESGEQTAEFLVEKIKRFCPDAGYTPEEIEEAIEIITWQDVTSCLKK